MSDLDRAIDHLIGKPLFSVSLPPLAVYGSARCAVHTMVIQEVPLIASLPA